MKTVNQLIATASLTEKELEVIAYLNEKVSFGEEYSDQDCKDIAEALNMKVGSVKGIVGSLCKKNILNTYDTQTGYEVVYFWGQENMSYEKIGKVEAPEAVEAPKAKSAHKVGDIHSNGKWAWTEYKPGKFDWRGVKPAEAITPSETTEEEKKTAPAAPKAVIGELVEATLSSVGVEPLKGYTPAGECNHAEAPKAPKQEKPKAVEAPKFANRKAFINGTESDLTKEECKIWWDNYGKETFINASSVWKYSMGRIGSCTLSIVDYSTGKSKSFEKHPNWRPLAHYSYSVRGWASEYINIEGYCQDWEEIRSACSDTESITFYIQKHPHQ